MATGREQTSYSSGDHEGDMWKDRQSKPSDIWERSGSSDFERPREENSYVPPPRD